MTAAANLQMFPKGAPKSAPKAARPRKAAGTYVLTDNAVVTYQRTHGRADTRVLTALAERANMRYLPPLTVPALQEKTGLGERAVQKALVMLAAAGMCYAQGRAWLLGRSPQKEANNGTGRAGVPNGGANGQANSCTGKFDEKGVWKGKILSPKEWEGMGRKKDPPAPDTNSARAPEPAGGGGGNQHNRTDEGPAPVGAVPGGTPGTPEHPHQEFTPPGGENEDTMSLSNGSAGRAAPPAPTFATREAALAYGVLVGAGDELLRNWHDWVRALKLNDVAQERQLPLWAEWVSLGLTADLNRHLNELLSSSAVKDHWKILSEHRMAGVAHHARSRRQQAAERGVSVEELDALPAPAQVLPEPGELFQHKLTGTIRIVDFVSDGVVVFLDGSDVSLTRLNHDWTLVDS